MAVDDFLARDDEGQCYLVAPRAAGRWEPGEPLNCPPRLLAVKFPGEPPEELPNPLANPLFSGPYVMARDSYVLRGAPNPFDESRPLLLVQIRGGQFVRNFRALQSALTAMEYMLLPITQP